MGFAIIIPVVSPSHAAPAIAESSTSTDYVQPSGTKNGYPVYQIQDDGRHIAPQGTASAGARGAITLVRDGVRYYGYFNIPSNPRAVHMPLVVTAHGIQQAVAETYMHMQARSEAKKYATLDVDGYSGTWNAGRCCSYATQLNYTSSKGIRALIDEFRFGHSYDPARLYMVGFSNGGMMAYRMACENPDTFAAIAVVAGAHVTPCRPRKPVPVLHIHGTGDTKVPYNGTTYSATLKTSLPSAKQTTEVWRSINSAYGAATTLVTLRGFTHTWPTASNSNYDGTSQILAFLLARQKVA